MAVAVKRQRASPTRYFNVASNTNNNNYRNASSNTNNNYRNASSNSESNEYYNAVNHATVDNIASMFERLSLTN
jgi:hypothetical protein